MFPDCEGSDEYVVLQHVARDARHGPRRHLHPVDVAGAGFQLKQRRLKYYKGDSRRVNSPALLRESKCASSQQFALKVPFNSIHKIMANSTCKTHLECMPHFYAKCSIPYARKGNKKMQYWCNCCM